MSEVLHKSSIVRFFMTHRSSFRGWLKNPFAGIKTPVGIASRNGNPPNPLKKGEPEFNLKVPLSKGDLGGSVAITS